MALILGSGRRFINGVKPHRDCLKHCPSLKCKKPEPWMTWLGFVRQMLGSDLPQPQCLQQGGDNCIGDAHALRLLVLGNRPQGLRSDSAVNRTLIIS